MSFIGKVLNKLFVSAKVLGDEHLRIADNVIYILETSRSEHTQLLIQSLQEQGSQVGPRDILSVEKKNSKAMQYRLESLVEKLEFGDLQADISIVPVTIYHSHFPNRTSSWWRLAFVERRGAESWWARIVQLVFSGRQTLLQLDKPFSLKVLMKENQNQPAGVTANNIVTVMQRHFAGRRQATFGPELSNRKKLLDRILAHSDVQRQIQTHSEQSQQSFEKSEKYARQQINAIATNVSPSFIRLLSSVLTWFFSRTYRRITIKGIDKVRELAKDYQTVFVPCHRSHMDYVLMSWMLHNQGLMIPHIVAGDNLNAPVLGRFLKKGGAVFMRRSFYDDPLYAVLFKSYLKKLHENGHALEYFVEGGRSRTGRLLPPKGGLLSITLEACLQKNVKPIALVPVWISYDKLVESRSYAKQLTGNSKAPESLFGFAQSLKQFRDNFGDAVVSFADPILLSDSVSKYENMKGKSAFLAQQLMERISGACFVNESALLATVLLSGRRLRMSRAQLMERVNNLSSLLAKMPNAPVGIAKGSVEKWIADARLRGQLSVSNDDVYLTPEQACEMTYYRNQIHHLTLLVGLYLIVSKRYHKPLSQTVPKLIKAVYPYLAKELYWPWQGAEVNKALKEIRDLLIDQQLIIEEDKTLQVRNTALSVSLMQTVEPYLLRYYIVFRLLESFSDLSLDSLIDEAVRLAGLLHVEFGFQSPEYTDSKGLAGFIKAMREQGVLSVNEKGQVYASVDASGLMTRSRQVLLTHYITLVDKNLRK